MKLKDLSKATPYIEHYINFVFLLIHELSYYIVAFIGIFIGNNEFPTLKITRKFKVIEVDKEYREIYNTSANVSYVIEKSKCNSYFCILISAAPIFSTVLLFLISPWWLYPLYLSNISTMWISVGDRNQIIDAIKYKRDVYKNRIIKEETVTS